MLRRRKSKVLRSRFRKRAKEENERPLTCLCCAAFLVLHVANGDEIMVRRDDVSIIAPAHPPEYPQAIHTKIQVHDHWIGVVENYGEVKRMANE
jgi:hypothetical protein